MTNFRHLISLLILLFVSHILFAQDVVYQCDFEDPNECRQWTLNKRNNPRITLKDIWHIGQPGQFGAEGSNGLYISSAADSTQCISSGEQVYTVAFRNITLPSSGKYTLLFSCRLLGSDDAKLHVWWLPMSYNLSSNNGMFSAQTWRNYGGIALCSDLYGQENWTPVATSVNFTDTVGRLVFLWESTKEQTPVQPAACVDEIELISGTPCTPAPSNMHYQSGSFTWDGWPSAQYEVRCHNTRTYRFDSIRVVTGTTYLPNLPDEGYTNCYVRRLCSDSTHSAWSRAGGFIWKRGERCIEYLDFGASYTNCGLCYVGSHQNSYYNYSLVFGTSPNMVDNGYQSDESMHTIHYDHAETDPHSSGELHTVPDDEMASVRLGAYSTNGYDACITYTLPIAADATDMLQLKYACVLQSGGHENDNPFVKIELLNQQGQLLPGNTYACFVADQPEASGSKWHSNDDIWWSEWDKLLLPLSDFAGQTITVRIIAARCIYDTHFGYVYFTLNCAPDDIPSQLVSSPIGEQPLSKKILLNGRICLLKEGMLYSLLGTPIGQD